MVQQVPINPAARADDPDDAHRAHPVAPDIAYQRHVMVNVVYLGPEGAGDRGWVLVDAGLPGSRGAIERAAAERFGEGARPAAIVMTHGHVDHVGALEALAEAWDAPVYAHPLEHPYLDGTAAYPPPDPTVGGGAVALLSPLFPTSPVNVGARLRALSDDGSVPGLPGWRWVATPGHSAGHVSLHREADGALIAGDAFVTTAQESVYAVAVQAPEMHGPPRYLTTDWVAAAASVRRLAALRPELAVTGHGRPMRGGAMRAALDALARDFERVAVPEGGRYAERPAREREGGEYRAP